MRFSYQYNRRYVNVNHGIKFLIISALMFLMRPSAGTAQQKPDKNYFEQTVERLKSNPIIEDAQFIEQYYDEQTLKQQSIYVKFVNDSVDRYFQVGKCCHYYPNGKLQKIHNVDPNTLVEKDTAVIYNIKGEIEEIIHNNEIKTLEVSEINSSRRVSERKPLLKKYFLDVNESVFAKENELVDNLPVHKKTPLRTINILYENGRIAMYAKYKYSEPQGEYYTTGDYFFYDENGKIAGIENDDWVWEENSSGISWRKLHYLGDNTQKVKNYINNYFQDSESSSFSNIRFAKGFYIQGVDTFHCMISVFHPVEKNNQNIFFIAKQKERLDIMTAVDVGYYTFENREFYSYNDNYHYYFHELLSDGRAKLYERDIVPTDSSLCYYLSIPESDYLYVLKPRIIGANPENFKEVKDYDRKIEIINNEERIVQFLLNIPDLPDRIKMKIETGMYGIDNIPEIIKEYN